jgi:hypothetical protein
VNYNLRIEEALNNETANVSFLSRLPDAKLEKKLNIVREQMNLATGNKDALALLRIWERQIIEARVIKHEQQPELNERSEIEMELAEIEAMDKLLEERLEILKRTTDNSQRTTEERPLTIDDRPLEENEEKQIEVNQLKLF